MMPVAIICGGLGTRLGELTRDRPKSLVEVNGRPFIIHQLYLLWDSGYRNIVVLRGHLGKMIRSTVGDCVRYSTDHGLGTGGAVKNALHLLGPEFMTLYGDSYLDCPYAAIEEAFHRRNCVALTTRYKDIIDYGLGVFRAEAFDGFEGKFSLNEVYESLALRDQLGIFHMSERFYEIGSPKGLEETCRHLQRST